jgi:peptidyl-prolyl cis-trans isomerase SurA
VRGLCIFLFLVLAAGAKADLIDRIAVSVGNSVITTSDIDREIRVTAFLNGAAPNFTSEVKRATADRMVEQKLIRRELETSRYPVPDASEIAPALAELRKKYTSDEDWARALQQYGITENDVKKELLWQRTLLEFIEVRFRPGVQVTDKEIQDYFDKVVEPAAKTAHPGEPVALEDYRDQIERKLAGERVDHEVDTWLQEARKRTGIVYHPEAFE